MGRITKIFKKPLKLVRKWPEIQQEKWLVIISQQNNNTIQFSYLLSHAQHFVTQRTAAHQASLSITNSWSLLKLMSTKSVMSSNHLILCGPLLLLLSIFPSIRVFFNESVLHIRLLKYWNFSFSISSSNEYSGLVSFRMDWLGLLAVKELSSVISKTTAQKHQFFGAQLSL